MNLRGSWDPLSPGTGWKKGDVPPQRFWLKTSVGKEEVSIILGERGFRGGFSFERGQGLVLDRKVRYDFN